MFILGKNVKSKELLDSMMVDAYNQAITEKKRELEFLKKEVLKYQASCKHPLVAVYDKQKVQLGFATYENEYCECVICSAKIELPVNDDTSVIDMTNYEFSDTTSDVEELRDRKKQLVKIKYQKVSDEHPDYDMSAVANQMNYEISGQKVLAKIKK